MSSTTSRRTCYFGYDAQADVAVVGFGHHPTAGGRVIEIADETRLPGLIRTWPNGQFKHLEVLGAARRVAGLVSGLHVSSPPPRGMLRGTATVEVTVPDDHAWVRIVITEADDRSEARGREVVVAGSSGDVVVRLGLLSSGEISSLTLFSVGQLTASLLDTAPVST